MSVVLVLVSKEASDIKFAMEHLKDPTLKPPDPLDGNNAKNKAL